MQVHKSLRSRFGQDQTPDPARAVHVVRVDARRGERWKLLEDRFEGSVIGWLRVRMRPLTRFGDVLRI